MLTAKSNRAVLKTGLVLSSSGISHQLDEEWDLDAFAELFSSSQNTEQLTPRNASGNMDMYQLSSVQLISPSHQLRLYLLNWWF